MQARSISMALAIRLSIGSVTLWLWSIMWARERSTPRASASTSSLKTRNSR